MGPTPPENELPPSATPMAQLAALRTDLAEIGYDYENCSISSSAPRVGLHYTPVAVAAPIVRSALRPLLRHEDGTPKTLNEILELRIFDPALGGGVFLLETCFQLTEFLWNQGEMDPQIPYRIASHCLFGADIDPAAVSIARQTLRRFCEFPLSDSRALIPSSVFLEQNLICADSLKIWDSPHPSGSKPSRSSEFQLPVKQFDVVLGNPPFLGGRKIRRVLGDAYFHFLTHEFTSGESGNADLSVYFFRLAERILRPGGICGFLATNTVCEGDSRKTGLDVLLANGAFIFRVETFPWPGNAAVHVTAIHLQFPKGKPCRLIPPTLNGKPATEICASLKHLEPARTAHQFSENETLCYQGCVLAAKGFILTPEEAKKLWETDEKYRNVVLPYFTGDDIFSASNPLAMTPRRFVISFQDWPLERAESEYPLAFEIVRKRVLPVRQLARRAAHRLYWWQFGDKRPTLMRLIQEKKLKKLLIQTRHSRNLCPTWVPTDAIYSESTILFPTESPELLAVLNSGIHEAWVRETSSSLGNELRYSPTDCFNTFPLPALKRVSLAFFELRNELCQNQNCGLTALYGQYHDPAKKDPQLEKLRELHVTNDTAVLNAYGWDDLKSSHEFHETSRGIRFELQNSIQKEILERLTQAQNFRFLYS